MNFRSWLGWGLLVALSWHSPLASASGASRFLTFLDPRTPIDCSAEIAQLREPYDEELTNYSGSVKKNEVGKLRYELWLSFLRREFAQSAVPFSLALKNKLGNVLEDLGYSFPIFPIPLTVFAGYPDARNLPALFTPQGLYLNAFSYRENPNILFAQALWKMWVFRQAAIDQTRPWGVLRTLREELLRVSNTPWTQWEQRLSRTSSADVEWEREDELSEADRGLIAFTAEAFARIATFHLYERTHHFHPEIKSRRWDKGLRAQAEDGSAFKHWFVGQLAKRFKLEPYEAEYILMALSQSGLARAWEFPAFPENLGYEDGSDHVIQMSSGNEETFRIQFVKVGTFWWVKRTEECFPFRDTSWNRRCDQMVVHRNMNPLHNMNARLRWITRTDRLQLGQVMVSRTSFMSTGKFYPWNWDALYFLTDGQAQPVTGLVPAKSAWDQFVRFKEPDTLIDPELMVTSEIDDEKD